jgi:hypothetical protein
MLHYATLFQFFIYKPKILLINKTILNKMKNVSDSYMQNL